MAKRLPSEPPVLPGFTFIRLLGTGGFSDVFLYEQDLPRREVAVKVMLAKSGDSDVFKMFTTEADALARLSAHPSILSVYSASRAADGRPYLVMEHCPESYARVFREYVLSVGEVLDVGIRMAGALESVHRAGLLHRDVKPSNILKTVTSSPVLSDFGVASARFFALDESRIAMSIPWSAPEIISESVVGSVASDIWSLGATVYSLLAGRSPFERDGEGANSAEAIQRRIRKAKYTLTGRADVPESIETVLARAMSLRPDSRQSSASVFGEQLQEVQRELGLAVTELNALGDPSMSESITAMARSDVRANRLPEQLAVDTGDTDRARARVKRESANQVRSGSVTTDDSTAARRHNTLSPRVAYTLAITGAVAIVLAIAIVVLGR